MNKYTEDVEKVFKTIQPPHPSFVVDLVEYPGHLGLRVYRPNILSFNQAEKVALATYLYELRDAIRQIGVGCEIEGVENEPPARERVSAARERLLRGRENLGKSEEPGGLLLPGQLHSGRD